MLYVFCKEYLSNCRGLDEEEERLIVQGYGNVTSMQFTGSYYRCYTVGETGASCYNFHSKSRFHKNMPARYFSWT